MPHRMLIVGVGSIGERHLRCFQNTGRVDELGLCEVNDQLRREIAERYQISDAQHMALPGVTVEDTVNVLARHGSTMACYSLNQFQAPSQFTFSVHCESGSVEYSESDNRLRWINKIDGPWHEQPLTLFTERDGYYVAQAHAFLDAFEGKGPLLCTLEEGLQTLRVNLAVMKSALETGGWVDVPMVEAAKIAS